MWFTYAFATLLLTSTLSLLMQVLALRALDSKTFAFVYNLVGVSLLGLTVLLFGWGTTNLNGYLIALMVLSGLGYGLFHRYQFIVRKHLDVSQIQVQITPTNLAGYLLAVVWLHEAVTVSHLLGFALLMIASLMAVWQRQRIKLSRYSWLLLFIGVCLSLAGTIDRQVAPHFSQALSYALVIWVAQLLVTFWPYVSVTKVRQELRHHGWKLPVVVIINLVATFTMVSAIRLAPATQVQPILAANCVLVTLLGIVILKERDRARLKLAAAGVATIGLLLISR